MPVEKVCPVVVRGHAAGLEILAFAHPLAGWQLVKGTREPGESIAEGALRELAEESGIVGQAGAGTVWTSEHIAAGQVWHFVPVTVGDVPDRFSFHTLDDGGHRFDFFWWNLTASPGPEWHPFFVLALDEISARTPTSS
ncbi:MAG: NUDIX domain-containing protein [Devosia sp.]|uniref:NUDIX hydrolase n=1 Tax=Devosia sp. TaxID=1871048 RepID=UPI0024C5992D|nr:NUDIX domain-containing protein [Devosia sp.]UYO00341.1 MAG: NUDIX domain-containing protein [Devosia sp.]